MKTFKLNKGVHLHVIKSEKFKDVSIYFNYYQKATSENRIARTYLSHLIGDKTDKYPTKALLLKQLDNLYGASHNVSHNIYGGASILQVSLRVLNDVYSEKGVLLKSFGLLKEMIEHSIINTESFEEARRNLIDSSNRKLEKPATFATSQANAIYGKGSYLALNSILQPEEIIEANIEEVISQHQELINKNRLDIFIFGDVDSEEMAMCLNNIFKFEQHDDVTHQPPIINPTFFEEVTEYRDIDQCNIVMMYKTNVENYSKDFYDLKLANCIFGSFPTSLLFQEVREKNSLCYSISSVILAEEGALMVRTGIDQENLDKTIELIKKQFERMQNGDFDSDILVNAKTLYNNILYGSSDDKTFTMNMLYHNILAHKNVTIEDICAYGNQVTIEDVKRVFNKLELKLIYNLKKQVTEDE